MGDFKLPSELPQDLLLIQDFVSDWQPPAPASSKQPVAKDDDSDDSSSSSSSYEDLDSEDEVLKMITTRGRSSSPETTAVPNAPPAAQPEMSSDSDISIDSDSESEVDDAKPETSQQDVDADLDDDEENSGVSGPHVVKTAHELDDVDASIAVPDVEEIPQDEVMERVGQIVNVMKRSVIVKGSPGADVRRANESALDAETLLVFEDRRVLGYIHETFGPTYDPFYVVKFRSSHPPLTETAVPTLAKADVDVPATEAASEPSLLENSENDSTVLADAMPQDKIPSPSSDSRQGIPSPYTIGRPVFHVPNRSRFVFVSELKRFKGTDASNAHDEEPIGNDPLDFSDDEAEAAHKRSLKAERQMGDKRKWSESASNSRAQTPAQMRDQDLAPDAPVGDSESFYGSNPYDEYSPYDAKFSAAGPSNSGRQIVAYDDPYADSITIPPPPSDAPPELPPPIDIAKVEEILAAAVAASSSAPTSPIVTPPPPPHYSRDDERGRGGGKRGRGRGRGGAAGDAGRGGRGRGRGYDRGRGRGRGRGGFAGNQVGWQQQPASPQDAYDPHSPAGARPLSPASQAIARATGQHVEGGAYGAAQQFSYSQNVYDGGYSAGSGVGFGGGWGQPQVQPHINPRFAAQWGMQVPGQWSGQYGMQGQWDPSWQQNGPGNGYGYPGGDGSSQSGQGP